VSAGDDDTRIDGLKAIALTLEVSPKKVRMLAMRANDPLEIQWDHRGAFVKRSYLTSWMERQRRTYLEALTLGLVPGVRKPL
jgi:hypothetical protein